MAVRVPVRRGVARRLGLRLPPYPAGLITFPGEVGEEALAEFVERWEAARGRVGGHHVQLLDNRGGRFTPSEPLTPLFRREWLESAVVRPRPPWWRRWWQRFTP